MNSMSSAALTSIKFMTYNVWSCEDIAVYPVYRRIRAICEVIERHDPDVIFLQEVTNYIYRLFQEAPWWENYTNFSSKEKFQSYTTLSSDSNHFCLLLSKLHAKAKEVGLPVPECDHAYTPSSPKLFSPSPPPSPQRPCQSDARPIPYDLLSARVYETKCRVPGGGVILGQHRLSAATCSLEGPTPSDIGSVHRRDRASAFLAHFDALHMKYGRSSVLDDNVVLGGDLGWDDDLDGPLRLGDDGWVDAARLRRPAGRWVDLDAVANPMVRRLSSLPKERRRPDRFICKLRDFTLDSIQMLGVEPIPRVTRFDDDGNVVPVLPSHHFGLLLTISPKRN